MMMASSARRAVLGIDAAWSAAIWVPVPDVAV